MTDGKTALTVGVAMVSMFLDIPPAELAAMRMPEELHKDAFDRQVRELHDQGMKYPAIAQTMDAPLNVVTFVIMFISFIFTLSEKTEKESTLHHRYL